jgi:hypothetical protein
MNGMTSGMTRAVMTLLAAAIGGVGLWLIGHFDQTTTGGWWAAMGIIAGAGLLFGIAQIQGRGGNPAAVFLVTFLPVLIAGGWVLLAMQPHSNWFRDHVRTWDGNMDLVRVVHYAGMQVGVIAFVIGLTFGLTFEAGYLRRRRTETVAIDQTAADAPMTAERHTVVVEKPTVTHEVEQVEQVK